MERNKPEINCFIQKSYHFPTKRLFVIFMSKLWLALSWKCSFFGMKDFVSVLFLCTGPSRGLMTSIWDQKQKNRVNSSRDLMSFRKKVKNLWWPQFRCMQNLKFAYLYKSEDSMKIFRKWSFRPCYNEFPNVLSSRTKLPLK